jgi:hypothetical protein
MDMGQKVRFGLITGIVVLVIVVSVAAVAWMIPGGGVAFMVPSATSMNIPTDTPTPAPTITATPTPTATMTNTPTPTNTPTSVPETWDYRLDKIYLKVFHVEYMNIDSLGPDFSEDLKLFPFLDQNNDGVFESPDLVDVFVNAYHVKNMYRSLASFANMKNYDQLHVFTILYLASDINTSPYIRGPKNVVNILVPDYEVTLDNGKTVNATHLGEISSPLHSDTYPPGPIGCATVTFVLPKARTIQTITWASAPGGNKFTIYGVKPIPLAIDPKNPPPPYPLPLWLTWETDTQWVSWATKTAKTPMPK